MARKTQQHPQTASWSCQTHPNPSQTHPRTSSTLRSDLLSHSERPQNRLSPQFHYGAYTAKASDLECTMARKTQPHPQTASWRCKTHPNPSQTHPRTSLTLRSDLLSHSERLQNRLSPHFHYVGPGGGAGSAETVLATVQGGNMIFSLLTH